MNSANGIGSVRPRSIGTVVAWAFSIFAGLAALGALGQGRAIPGILFALSAVVVLPPAVMVAQERLGINIPVWLKVALCFGLFIGAAAFLPKPDAQQPTANSATTQSGFVPVPRGVALAKLLLVDDFQAYLNGGKVVGGWGSFFPLEGRVAAPQLFSAYHANEVAADNQFKDKTLVISGIVESINKDAFDNGYLVLNDGNPFEGVHAQLSDDSMKDAGRLSRGEQVTLICTGAGMIIGSPVAKECDTVQVIVARERSKIETMVDDFFDGAKDQSDHIRSVIAAGYVAGTSLPQGARCLSAIPGDMGSCTLALRSVPKDQLKRGYIELSRHFALPSFPKRP